MGHLFLEVLTHFFKVIGAPSQVHGQEIPMLSGPTAKVYVISFKESENTELKNYTLNSVLHCFKEEQ